MNCTPDSVLDCTGIGDVGNHSVGIGVDFSGHTLQFLRTPTKERDAVASLGEKLRGCFTDA
ncbi:hypothetical protein StoSoilB3_18880 [Arthrobacter sp. StoSoilB3]|nr:hypothetical protein StoSoilB3_18880 [Arthrobacter sp. StoSoilB3]